jgi:putative transposase
MKGLDDYSRYVVGWKLCGTMRAEHVTDTLDIALATSGCDSAKVLHKPRLLSDRAIEGAIGSSPMARGSSYSAGDLAKYLEDKGMKHVRGAPMHLLPGRRLLVIAERAQTQGKIERWHQTLKNRILLENYFFEGELEAAIATFIGHDNNHRYHESIGNLTPADVYFGRGKTILAERRRIKLQTIQNRRLNHQRQAA